MPANSFLGENSTATAGEYRTPTQVTALLDIVTSTLKGLAPSSGGGTANFLRADATWAAPVPPGRLLSVQVLTTGTTYTRPAGVVDVEVFLLAGGGAGGGAAGVASQAAAGSGGGGGSWLRKRITGVAATVTIAIGAGGTAGAAGNNPGNAGGNTTWATPALTANGGPGGAGMASGTAGIPTIDTLGGAVSTGGDINSTGNIGVGGERWSATVAYSGSGGNSPWGNGGRGLIATGSGDAGTGFGSGGSGGVALTAVNQVGGVGKAGLIIVFEYS